MGWFKYLKSSESLGVSEPNTNYSYPYLKRYISKFTPLDTLSKDSWVYINIEDVSIDKYYNSSLEENSDDTSYLVVYENPKSDSDFNIVRSVVNNNILYFQTYEDHIGTQEISNQYAIYYKTPGLRYLKKVDNGGVSDYQLTTEELSEYTADFSDVNLESFTVTTDSDSYYNFSFYNNWNNGLAGDESSSLTLSFTGPNIFLYGDIGLDFGKFQYRIVSLKNDKNLYNSIDVDWTTIDCYSSDPAQETLILSHSDLSDRDYILELRILSDKNILSSGNKINIKYYTFTYNVYLELDGEQLTENSVFISLGGIR